MLQVAKEALPEARFRAAAATVQSSSDTTSVIVFGGHHRCETSSDFSDFNSDGGCDEIAQTVLFVGNPEPPVFIVTENDA